MHVARRLLAQGSSSRYTVYLRGRRLPHRRAISRSAGSYAGAYTTARTVNRDAVFELDAHIKRLASSCQQMLDNDAKVQLVLAPHFKNAASFWFLLVALTLLQNVPANQMLLTCARLQIPLCDHAPFYRIDTLKIAKCCKCLSKMVFLETGR